MPAEALEKKYDAGVILHRTDLQAALLGARYPKRRYGLAPSAMASGRMALLSWANSPVAGRNAEISQPAQTALLGGLAAPLSDGSPRCAVILPSRSAKVRIR
jgi:hypothetical protein